MVLVRNVYKETCRMVEEQRQRIEERREQIYEREGQSRQATEECRLNKLDEKRARMKE